MISTRELKDWCSAFGAESFVAIDDGGLRIVELDAEGKETGNYIELGGVPEPEVVDMFCQQCGHAMGRDAVGISHHLDVDGDIDYDQDADHVAVTEVEP